MSDVAFGNRVLGGVLGRRRRVPVVIGICFAFVCIVGLMAAAGSLVAPYDPNATNLYAPLAPPTLQHWLGTDSLGRDLLSRIIAGARTAVLGPLIITVAALLIGNGLGLLAGYRGGRVDALIMRWVDLMYALPALLVSIVLVGVFGASYAWAVAILSLFTAPYDTQLVRGATLEQRPLAYVEAAKALGLPAWRIVGFHIWPNVLPVVVANSFLNFAFSLVALSGLSYLGLGVNPGTPDWGRMLAENSTVLFQSPITALAPAAMIILTATSMNLIGDWLFEWFSDRGRAR